MLNPTYHVTAMTTNASEPTIQSGLQKALRGVLVFVATIWIAWLVNWLFQLSLNEWGVFPRHLRGLVGIPLAPFLHAGFGHLLSNTVPMVILLVLLTTTRSEPWWHVVEIIIVGGLLLWLFGRNGTDQDPTVHVGASGLIYGLIMFLIVVGFREKQLVSLAVALVVGFFYGGSLVAGVLPTQEGVSWDGHLTGALAGLASAMFVQTQKSASVSSR